jgi:hypothetical protein
VEKDSTYWTVMVGSLCVVLMQACNSISADGKQWIATPEDEISSAEAEEQETAELGALQQPLTGTSKICSVVSTSAVFRDSIPVPDGWTVTRCITDYRNFVGGNSAQLGCMTSTGFVLAAPGNLPSPNCGW